MTSLDRDTGTPSFVMRITPGSPPDELPRELNPRFLLGKEDPRLVPGDADEGEEVKEDIGVNEAVHPREHHDLLSSLKVGNSPSAGTLAALSQEVKLPPEDGPVARILSFRQYQLDREEKDSTQASAISSASATETHQRSVETLSTCLHERHEEHRRQIYHFHVERDQWQAEIDGLKASLQQHQALSLQHLSSMKTELAQHYEQEMRLVREQHQAELVESARLASDQAARYHRFKASLRFQAEYHQRQLQEANRKNEKLEMQLQRLRQRIAELESGQNQGNSEIEEELLRLQGQVGDVQKLRAKLERQEEEYRGLEDELLEALDHIEDAEELNSLEMFELTEKIRSQAKQNEELKAQLEETVTLAEKLADQLLLSKTSKEALDHLNSLLIRLAVVTRHFLLDRFPNDCEGLPELIGPTVDAGSLLRFVELAEGSHAQLLLDQTLDGDFLMDDDSASVSSNKSLRSLQPPSKLPALKSRFPSQDRSSSCKNPSSTTTQPRHRVTNGHSSAVGYEARMAQNTFRDKENDDNAVALSHSSISKDMKRRSLSDVSGSRASSAKPPRCTISKLARPVAGKQRSALHKYGPKSVLNDKPSYNGSMTANPAVSGAFRTTQLLTSRNFITRDLQHQSSKEDSSPLEWTNVGRQIVDSAKKKQNATPQDKPPVSTRRHTLAVESYLTTVKPLAALSSDWSDAGRPHAVNEDSLPTALANPLQRSRTSMWSKHQEPHSLELRTIRGTLDQAIISPVLESPSESNVSPKAIIREVIKSLTPRGNSSLERAVPETPRETPIPTETIDMTPLETTVGAKFETLVTSWSTSRTNSNVDSPTGMIPSSLCFSTNKKVKRGSESSTSPSFISTAETSKVLDLPSSKRMRRDPTFGRATPVRNHEIQQFVHATPFPLREEISALFSPEELLLSPLPIDQKFDPIRTSVNTLDFSSTRTLESTKAAVEERSDVVQMCKAHPRVHPMKPTSEECTSACAGSTSRDDSARTFPALAPSENWVFESIDHSTLHDVSATLLARAFKAYEVRSCYKQWRKSVIRLQALYRGSAARSRIRGDEAIRRLTSAVIVIQAAWRSSCAQKCVARVIRAVLLLQSASRVFIARRRLQKSKVNAASTCVQSAWRRHLARVGYNCKLRSLCVLQSLARKFLARVEYLRLRSAERKRLAALKIQRTWRGTSSRREYILKQRSTQLIQSAFRGISTRRAITSRRRRSASTCVQAAWRRHVCRQKLAVSRRAMIFIQTFVRTGLAKSEFERLHQVRKNDTSALIIQRAWRCISERRSYIDCLGAAMLIQSAYRGFVARQRIMAHRNNYAARYIQACWRCNVNHVKFTSTRQRIILVQSFTRKKQAISKLVQLRTARERNLAALMVQKSWRCSNARRNFTVCLRKAILIQSAYRGVLVRQARKAHRKNVACTLVQVAWKCYMYRKIYKASRLAAILLQSHVRTQQARMRHECLILARKQEDSASTIQVLWRGSYARRTFVEHLCKAMLIQSVFRGFLVRKELNSSRNNTACTVLQETWRLYMARKKYADLRRATILVQTMARSRLANSRLERLKLARERKLELAALDIQRLIRGSFTRRSLKVARELDRAASTIQRFWRLNSARKSYDRSAVLLQSAFRSFRARKLRNKMVLVITACIIIQAAWRGHNSRSQYQQVTFAAVRVQALIRGVFARAELNLPRSTKEAPDNAALIIQAMWRSWSIRGTFLATLSAAKVIQSTIRRRLALNICSRLRERNAKRAACLRIQSTWNGYIHRRKYSMAVRSLVVIQATARMHIAKSHLRNLRSARLLLLSKLILLQSLWRRFAARRHYFHASNNRRALVIQTKWRAWSSRNRFCRMKASSVTIQTTARRHLAQRHSSTLLVAITKLQACLRGSAQRLSFQRKLRAVVLLQAIGRGFATRVASRMRRSNIAATAIQSLFRGSIARQQVTERCHAAVVLQTCWRGYSTYRHYLKVLRAFMTLKEAETLSPADRPHKMDQADVPLPIFDTPGRRPNRGSSAAKQAPEDVVSTRKPLGDLGLTPRTSASSQTNARATRSREQLKLETGAMKVNRCTSREEVQKLKVVELRDVLRQRGVESKLYRNLRKAELIQLVLEDDD